MLYSLPFSISCYIKLLIRNFSKKDSWWQSKMDALFISQSVGLVLTTFSKLIKKHKNWKLYHKSECRTSADVPLLVLCCPSVTRRDVLGGQRTGPLRRTSDTHLAVLDEERRAGPWPSPGVNKDRNENTWGDYIIIILQHRCTDKLMTGGGGQPNDYRHKSITDSLPPIWWVSWQLFQHRTTIAM